MARYQLTGFTAADQRLARGAALLAACSPLGKSARAHQDQPPQHSMSHLELRASTDEAPTCIANARRARAGPSYLGSPDAAWPDAPALHPESGRAKVTEGESADAYKDQ